ncbi:MAG: hypothetical protein KUA43_00880 [Hoeflea sp.]|uniref:hypothetical protein n=1 Tax=Hoeflea sp. TaxID=1940281 RepID=UPI001D1E58AC|nr:hypothetical protein [Hoeflea sp.]MBU4530389.1 hypothetical protein [Alphaproteobacteria bacterium]MBU4545176.1 hypothetical protein [Alphaproteobacteria bacterium]MBU4549624.1 hypothetical protein [Alphaproteobacteria bacterium]MBV1721979.1 hypothetical protein [Hoeflea sp.]MBV1761329.1 hypothetical protein [Hoeflea sp.]
MNRFWPMLVVAPGFALAACSPAAKPPAGLSAHAQSVSTLQRVNTQANACWLKDSDFKNYGIVPELDTTSTPRVLIIPRGKPQSLPQAVIVASAGGAQFYGPLSTSPLAGRINSDISRWASGATGC